LDPDIAYDTKCLPFNPKILNYYFCARHRAAILHGDEKYATDGEELCRLPMKELVGAIPVFDEGPLQKRMWCVTCSLAVGHGGEIKFQRYDERATMGDDKHSDSTKVLCHWSRKIQEDVVARDPNGPIPLAEGDLRKLLSYLVKENQILRNIMIIEQQHSTEDQQQLIENLSLLVQTIASQMTGTSGAARGQPSASCPTPTQQDDDTMYLPVTPGVALGKASK
jgi:hypothetical protein